MQHFDSDRTAVLPARAGLGLKPEHYRCDPRRQARCRLLRDPRRELHGRRRPAAPFPRGDRATAIRCRCTASACRSAARRPLDRAHLARLKRLSSATGRHRSPSISPGRRMTAAISTICCRCPIPRRRWSASCAMSTRRSRRSACGCCWKTRRPICFSRKARSTRCDFLARGRRSAAAAACCSTSTTSWCRRSTTGSIPLAYIDRFPVELVGEIHLAGYDETVDGAGERLLIDAHGIERA